MQRRVVLLAGLYLLAWLGYAVIRQVTTTEPWRASLIFPHIGVVAAVCVTSLLLSVGVRRWHR